MTFLARRSPRPAAARGRTLPPLRSRLSLEQLETRLVPSASGDAWVHPNLVTISFVPDGTVVSSGPSGPIYSNLFATFNAKFGSAATWQNEILKAAQVWAQQANLNFTIVSDNGADSGTGNYQQGDPGMGDIRIGGYAFSSNNYLAGTFMPPPDNNYSVAGDMNFNTGQTFNINSTYDLQTVAMHEFGHAIGLGHSADSNAIMWPSYTTQKRALGTDDVATVQSIYGARNHDLYNTGLLSNGTFATAAPITSLIDPVSLTTVINPLDITTTGQKEYFALVAPLGTSNTFTVTVQSSGLSLLRPTVKVYAADQYTVLGSASSGTVYNGATLTVTVSGVTAGQLYYIKVGGYDTTAFGTGAYGLSVNCSTGTSPAILPPTTQVLNGSILQGGGGIPMEAMMDMMEVSYNPNVGCSCHGRGCTCPMCRAAASALQNAQGLVQREDSFFTGTGQNGTGTWTIFHSATPAADASGLGGDVPLTVGGAGDGGGTSAAISDDWFSGLVDLWTDVAAVLTS